MPSSATITAFYNFTANTKARASQVNANFDLFRGHLVPIEPLTATASDITYDVGSDEHRWRTGYFKTLDFDRSTSTSNAYMQADPNTTASEVVLYLNSVEKMRVNANGVKGLNANFLSATTTAAAGQLALSSGINISSVNTTVAYNIPGSTLTVTTTGRPLFVGLVHNDSTSGGSDHIYMVNNNVNALLPPGISLLKDGAGYWQTRFGSATNGFTTTAYNSATDSLVAVAPPSATWNIYFLAAGTYTFHLATLVGDATDFFTIQNVKLAAFNL